jgi:hypothetical protein
MKGKLYLVGMVLVLGAMALASCSYPSAVKPAEDITDEGIGEVVEVPAEVRVARDLALTRAGAPKLNWAEENITPGWPEETVPGWMEYRFTAEGWEVRVGYAVVAPEQVVYQVTVTGSDGFSWVGEVDGAERMTDSADEAEPPAIPNPTAARDAAMAFISQNYAIWSTEAPAPELSWVEESLTAEGLVGATTYRYTAEGWMVTVSFPLVAPDATIYQIAVLNVVSGFEWAGEVDARGEVTEQFVYEASEAGAGGQAEPSLPSAGVPVVAWYGYIESAPFGAQYDDYLILMPEGSVGIGIEGADAATEAEIVALRDRSEPGKYAHFWGSLTCDVLDHGGCQLLVTRLRVDGPGPFFSPDPVDGWVGTIVSGPPGPRSGGDDCLVLSSEFPVEYGIDSTDAEMAAAIEVLRDSGTSVRIWGQVSAGVMDWSGTQIQVERIEALGEMPVPGRYEGWEGFFNYRFGYGFLYPPDLTVLEDQDGNVNISGPLVDNERWPCISVSTYESDFYRPPAGSSVVEWVSGFGIPYDEMEMGLEIAELEAIHLKTYASQMAYAYDEYYFIKGDRLFRITIVQCGQEDWELYNSFLRGFSFPHAP